MGEAFYTGTSPQLMHGLLWSYVLMYIMWMRNAGANQQPFHRISIAVCIDSSWRRHSSQPTLKILVTAVRAMH